MEERGVEECWEIVDYNSLRDYSEDDDDDDQEKSINKWGWILDAGLSLGKKIVITGVVISSAPVVVPPLLVISALGCAFSVPFGVVFASYACTDKLMSKLMMLEYGTPDGDEDDEGEEHVLVTEKEVEKAEQDNGIEIRINESVVDKCIDNDSIDTDGDKFNLEEKDGDEFLLKDIKVGELSKEEEKHEEPASFHVDSTGVGGHSSGAAKTNDDDHLRSKWEHREDKSHVAAGRKDVSLLVQSGVSVMAGKESGGNVTDKKSELSENRNETVEKSVNMVKGTDKADKKRQTELKGKTSNSKDSERRGIRKASKFQGKRREASDGDDESKLSTKDKVKIVIEGKDGPGGGVVAQETIMDGLRSERQTAVDEQKPVTLVGSGKLDNKQVSAKGDQNDDIDAGLVIIASEAADQSVIAKDKGNYDEPVGTIADDHAEYSSLTGIPRALKYDEEIPHQLKEKEGDHAVDMSGLPHPDEELPDDEEKIWKKIDAIRVIVGCKAPRRPSYFEELGALYLFTGIEPPPPPPPPPPSSSMEDPSDSAADFYDKLCFLISVIGLR